MKPIYEELFQEVQVLQKENLELRQIIEELQKALRKNSSNSHKPPSSDLFKRNPRDRCKPIDLSI
jgi:ribosomal protein L18E